MGQFIKVADAGALPPGEALAVEAGGRKIALFRVGDSYHAIDDSCTHRGGPLSEGTLDGTIVTCPWHAACFDVTSGKSLGPPASEAVACYPVRLDGNDIKVEVP